VVGGRERPVPTPGTSPTTGVQAPGTSGGVPSTGLSEQVVDPTARDTAAPPATALPPAKPAARPAVAPAPRAVAKTGRIVVTSNPPKAGVTINGRWSGRTPLTLEDAPFGNYVVRVVEPGFEVTRQQFALTSGAATRTVAVTLRPSRRQQPSPAPAASGAQAKPPAAAPPSAATTGEMFVDSRPRGATVFVDGRNVGVTPLRLTAQPPGPRMVRLQLADHQSWTTTTQVEAGRVARVTGSLEQIR
jgi:hypothetical protein